MGRRCRWTMWVFVSFLDFGPLSILGVGGWVGLRVGWLGRPLLLRLGSGGVSCPVPSVLIWMMSHCGCLGLDVPVVVAAKIDARSRRVPSILGLDLPDLAFSQTNCGVRPRCFRIWPIHGLHRALRQHDTVLSLCPDSNPV